MENKKNILIIGASSDIAVAVTKKLKNAAYTVLTTTRTSEDSTYNLDLTDSNSISEFEKIISNTPLHFIIYCAGFLKATEVTELFTGEYARTSQQINFTAAAQLLSKLSKNIQPGGGIIALSSTAGIWGNPQFPIYSSWKAALNTFLQSLNKQLEESGRFVFSICPGPTNTKMRQDIAGDAEKHQAPEVVASGVIRIMEHPTEYADSPILIIRNSVLYRLEQELIPIQ